MFYHISFQSTFICIFTFPIYIIKYQKYVCLIILSLSDLTFASGREGIDNTLLRWLRVICLFVQVRGTFEEPPTGLIPWFSKTEGNTYATIAASPFPLQGKPKQAQDVEGGSQTENEVYSFFHHTFTFHGYLYPRVPSVPKLSKEFII